GLAQEQGIGRAGDEVGRDAGQAGGDGIEVGLLEDRVRQAGETLLEGGAQPGPAGALPPQPSGEVEKVEDLLIPAAAGRRCLGRRHGGPSRAWAADVFWELNVSAGDWSVDH